MQKENIKIIVGLGNPGSEYKDTRHNVGFLMLDYLAEQRGLSWENDKKANGQICRQGSFFLFKPETFMNNSGIAVRSLLDYYKLLPKNFFLTKKNSDLSEILTVIHDDMDIALGKFKIAENSGSAGHNGVKSIINNLKTKNFQRVRIGIKTEKKEKMPAEKFVLAKFGQEEKDTLKKIFGLVAENF